MDPRQLTPDELYRLRLDTGWTQARLAHKLGVSRFTISRWESGTEPISLAMSLAIRMVMEREA